AADLAFTIDTDGDGNPEHQSSLSIVDGGIDTMEVPVNNRGPWTFGIVGRGVKLPRPLQGINYVELRVEYDISVVFDVEGNGSYRTRPLNAVFAPLFPGDPMEGAAGIETFGYMTGGLLLPQEEEPPIEVGPGPPWGLLAALLIAAVAAGIGYHIWRRRRIDTEKTEAVEVLSSDP
ncbi:MAG: hypothetical protein ACMUIE_10020, partial [Thermoplasmatota archaeon]